MCKYKYVKYGELCIGLLRLASSKDLKWQCSTWQYGISCEVGSGFLDVIFVYLFKLRPGPRGLRLATPLLSIPNSKVHGTNMGPIWGRQDPGGPHVGPMHFAIRGVNNQMPHWHFSDVWMACSISHEICTCFGTLLCSGDDSRDSFTYIRERRFAHTVTWFPQSK